MGPKVSSSLDQGLIGRSDCVLSWLWADASASPSRSPPRRRWGKWNTVDDKTGKVVSEVELYEQGGKLFGKITGLTELNDKQGKPKRCTACAGADKDAPIVGLVIVKDLAAGGDRYKGGTILDPEDGKSTRRRCGRRMAS